MATILIIDDSRTARAELRRALEESGRFSTILEADDGLAGLRLLLAETIDAVICDLEMPGLDGEKLLAANRSRAAGRQMPFLFLTAERDRDRMARLFRAGASDAIHKPFHPSELIARLETHLRLTRLQVELREKNTTLARLSTNDDLTGLRTRRYVGEVLAIELLRAKRYRHPLSLCMCDLDHFKQVNDSWGHPAGDAVLRAVSATLLRSLRQTDVAGRYGGEEMLVVLPHTDLEGAGAFGERVREAVEAEQVEVAPGRTTSVTISLGVATLDGEVETAEQLVEAADAALYRAKAAGRNRVALARPAPGVRRENRPTRSEPRAGEADRPGLDSSGGSRTPGRGGGSGGGGRSA